MVKVDIVLDHSRIFLFPASVALGSETNVIPPDDTTVRGEVVITTEEYTRIGPVRVVWEVARELKGKHSWGKRDVLARFESEITTDDSFLDQGETRYLFTFQIPSLLPPTTETAFDKTSHTLVASVLDPAPSYSAELPPAYDTDSSPRRQESFSSLSDWSFPSASNASRRSSLLSTPSGSQRSSIDHSRSGWSTPADSRRSSLAIPSSSRSSFSMASSDRPESRKQKKSLLGGFLRKSSTLSQASTSTDEPISQVDTIPTTPTCNDVELAEWLLPSSAASTRSLEVISCPAARGEICTVDWMKGSHTPGLGHSQRYIHSSIFSLGSGVNFDYNLSEIPASSTVHSIRLSLCQTTKAANSNKAEEVFTLFSRGTSSEGEHVWRGEVARSWDAQAQKSKSGRKIMGPVTQASLPGVVVNGSALRIRTKARLPTPMNGAVPTSPRLLDNRLSRVTHHLRIETFYSVLGEDVSGTALPVDSKSKDGRPQEGTIRRTWVDHEVIIGACCITPENILVPTYSTLPTPTTPIASAGGRQQTRMKCEDFSMPKTCTHTIATERGRRVSEQHETSGADLLASHAQMNDSRCLCFHDDATIAEMIGSLDKPNQNHVNLAQIDIGGIVKALYVPVGLQAQLEDLAAVQDVWRQQSSLVACS